MAEGPDLKSAQYRFESDGEDISPRSSAEEHMVSTHQAGSSNLSGGTYN
jgi:hypothetical protein